MADNILMPSSSGGLMRYNEEYKSKFMINPNHIVIAIAVIVVGMFILQKLY